MNVTATPRQTLSAGLRRVTATLVVTLAALLGLAGTANARPEPGPTPGVAPITYPDLHQTAAASGSGWGLPTVFAVVAIAAIVVAVIVIAQRSARHRRQAQPAV
jgi:hypothetical protein